MMYPVPWLAVLVLSTGVQSAAPSGGEWQANAHVSASVLMSSDGGAHEAAEHLLDEAAAVAENGLAQQRGQQAPTLTQGALLGAVAGCAFVGLLMGRAAPEDTRAAAFLTGCVLGAPLGAIAGFFAALGSR